jgi:hypothetical protein
MLLLIFATPSQANWRDDDILDKLDYWIDYADDLNYEVVEAEVYSIRDTDRFYRDLPAGQYHVYAEGDDDIRDMDMYAYNESGRELDSDTMGDNFPVLDFNLTYRQDVEFNVEVYEFARNTWSGEYVFILTRELGNSRYDDYSSHPWDCNCDYCRDHRNDNGNHNGWRNGRGNHDNDHRRGNDDNLWDDGWDDNWGRGNFGRDSAEQKLDDLIDYADDNDLRVIHANVDRITDTINYQFTLDRGRYAVYVSGDDDIDDLDLTVYEDWGDYILAEDRETDADPAVWFRLDRRETVTIEVEVWSFDGWADEGYFAFMIAEE